MKKHLLALSAAAVLLAPQAVGAEGFAINEWTAEGMAMGGARMFAENDAGNMAYNPAAMTKIQGEKIKASLTYLSPHGKWKAEASGYDSTNGEYTGTGIRNGAIWTNYGRNRVNPGIVPGLYYVKQLNDKEWLGMATYTRFGMICQFERDSIVATNAFSSRLNGTSIAMNYARKHDSKWSTSIGAEVNYVGLQLDKNLGVPHANPAMPGPLHIEGTSWALGWNAAANYEFDDKNEFAVVYRSKVKHSMEADYDAHGVAENKLTASGDAYGCVTLPESWMLGYGHEFNDKTRMELNATWTRWSRFDAFDMMMTPTGYPFGKLESNPKNWKDGWRYAIGIEHKLSDKYSLLAGIAHDERSIPDETADFMVPTGERDTYTLGIQYHDKKQTVALALGYMDVGELNMKGSATNAYARAKMYDSYTKMVSISYQYNF